MIYFLSLKCYANLSPDGTGMFAMSQRSSLGREELTSQLLLSVTS